MAEGPFLVIEDIDLPFPESLGMQVQVTQAYRLTELFDRVEAGEVITVLVGRTAIGSKTLTLSLKDK
jgi:hypothetical protein